jgi:hypothetical protein
MVCKVQPDAGESIYVLGLYIKLQLSVRLLIVRVSYKNGTVILFNIRRKVSQCSASKQKVDFLKRQTLCLSKGEDESG